MLHSSGGGSCLLLWHASTSRYNKMVQLHLHTIPITSRPLPPTQQHIIYRSQTHIIQLLEVDPQFSLQYLGFFLVQKSCFCFNITETSIGLSFKSKAINVPGSKESIIPSSVWSLLQLVFAVQAVTKLLACS